ncbi:MAG: hypothetical protein F8N15_07650, partial [Methanobacterium sp.]|nr:hypothetical protein [Methanobacterium sp.]
MPELKSIAIALVIMAFIGAGLGFMVKTHNQNRFDEQYGGQAGSVVLGARSFAAANRSEIIADIIAAGGNAVTYSVANSTGTAALQATGAIDTSLNGTTPTGGRYCLAFRTYNGGTNLQGVLTVVGETSPVSALAANVLAPPAG